MIDSLLSAIAPHPCYSCGQLGLPLCESCRYHIIDGVVDECIFCGVQTAHTDHECFDGDGIRSWCIGEREGILQQLIDDYKFHNMKAAASTIASLLSLAIGKLPTSITIVPIPTIPAHVRRRGYDHTLLIARRLAKLQDVGLDQPLVRVTTTVQKFATREQRFLQAAEAFKVKKPLHCRRFLLVDDVVTTGATLRYAARCLIEAGAEQVSVAVLCRQPLDEPPVI